MALEPKKTAIENIIDLSWGTHVCFFYETKQDLLDTLAVYFKAGLEGNEFCLWVISESLTKEEAIDALRKVVPNLDRYLASGSIEIRSYDEWYREEGVLDLDKVRSGSDEKLNEALARGYAGLRLTGDASWISDRVWRSFQEYEKGLSGLVANQRMMIFCTYPLATTRAGEIFDVARAHQFAIAKRRGIWEIVETPELKQTKAEIKRLNDELEQTVAERTRELAATNDELNEEITERKVAEESLRESQERFRQVAENLQDVIWVVDSKAERLLYVNPAYEKIWGGSSASLYQDRRAFMEPVHPDDREIVVRMLEEQKEGKLVSAEYRIIQPDGSVRWIRDRSFPVRNAEGEVYRVAGVAADITESKQAEEELQQSHAQLQNILDSLFVFVGVFSTEGVVLEANRAPLEAASLKREDVIGRPFPETYWWSYSAAVQDRLRAALRRAAEGEVVRYDEVIRIANDRRLTIDSSFSPLRDAQGKIVQIVGSAVDITERKRIEEKLRQSESQLAEAQRLASIGSWNWDIRNNTHTWSDELYHMYGLQPQESDPSYETFLELVHPDDRAVVSGAVEHALKTQEPINSYLRIIRSDGAERIIHSRGNTITDISGTPIRMHGTLQDVTERKQAEDAVSEAERKYRDIFENAGEGIFQTTPDGGFIAANPALARMHGFESPEELIRTREDISRQIYVDPTRREEFKRQLEEQGAVRGFEHQIFRKDWSKIWISVNARAVRDEQGAIQYYEGTAQDITDRKQAEERLQITSEQLRALSARLQSAREEEGTRIARAIHDELGSVLTSLKWDLEETDRILAGPMEPSQLAALRERLHALMKLTDSAISAIRRIASELRPSVLDDLGLLAAIEWQAQQFQARTGIVCHCDCSLEKVELSKEQSTAVFRILQEALTNVLRHAQATKIDIKINKENGCFALSVSDNGKGITESEKSEQQSLGILGMRERAHLIGGELDIKGVERKGTVVIVRVPISGQERVLKMTR